MSVFNWVRDLIRGSSGTAPSSTTVSSKTSPGDDETTARLRAAINLHTRGELNGAELGYHKLLDDQPDHIGALHLLGRLNAQKGNLDEAAAKLERAMFLVPEDADICADLADVRRLQGDLDGAERLLKMAVKLEPGHAARHYTLSRVLIEKGNHAEAIGSLEKTLSLESNHAEAHNDLGAAYLEAGRYDLAQRSLEAAVLVNPESPVVHCNLATLFTRLGKPERAVQYCRHALERAPDDDDIRVRLAEALLASGDQVAALELYLDVSERRPDDPSAFKRLADTAANLGRKTEAIDWYRRALEIEPRQPEVLNNLGILLSGNGEFEEAAVMLEAAVAIQSDLGRALDNLGGTYHLQGRYEDAVEAYRRALEIEPLNSVTLSNLIAITNYRVQQDADFVRRLHGQYRRSIAPERRRASSKIDSKATRAKRLRVGYVSPDFRQHSVAYFIEPVIAGHDRRRFEVYCYSDVKNPDAKTEVIKSLADHWRDVSGEDDDALASKIRTDEVDLLVDLSGHFSGNRLPVFVKKPAPVQLSYLGYPSTTGLTEVDYRLTDIVADPPGEAGQDYTETLLRLPKVFLCYRPPDSAPAVAWRPKGKNHVTFGSFNELPKVSHEAISAWCRILEAVPGAKLLLKATAFSDPATQRRVMQRFEAAGAAIERVELIARTATLAEHLALYARVDVALDTFPYNGTTTTCEAIYMGVPVVTLKGTLHAGRVGTSLLSALELPELICESESQYLNTAVALAGDADRLGAYRDSLRERLLRSPLCDSRAFVSALESAYLELWKRRLEGGG